MAGETKVFDVASPGSSKPETGSKPMVVGHKNMLDPSVKGPIESESSSNDPLPSRGEKTIARINENTEEKEIASVSDSKLEGVVVSSGESIAENIPESAQDEESIPEETPEDKQKAEDDLEIERHEKLEEMIKTRKYYAPIKEAGMTSFRTFFKTFVVVAIVGIILLVVLIDADILDLGVKLPFNFL